MAWVEIEIFTGFISVFNVTYCDCRGKIERNILHGALNFIEWLDRFEKNNHPIYIGFGSYQELREHIMKKYIFHIKEEAEMSISEKAFNYFEDAPSFEYQLDHFRDLLKRGEYDSCDKSEIDDAFDLLAKSIVSVCKKYGKSNYRTERDRNPLPHAVYRDEKKGATTILWSDGKKTTVVPNDPEKSDIFTGFCIAYTKRILGSTSNIERAIDACVWCAGSKKRARETANENRKMVKAIEREKERLLREEKIQKEIERLRIMDEAASRYSGELADKVTKGTGK